jgi:hypothetical protein
VTGVLLLGLRLPLADTLSVALLDMLIKRADLASVPVLGSVSVQAYFVDVVPASPTVRQELIMAWKRRR